MRRVVLTVSLLLLPFGVLAAAEDDVEIVTEPQEMVRTPNDVGKALVGAWELSSADHDRKCILTFKTDQAPTGFKVDLEKGCPVVNPATKDIIAWKFGDKDALLLLDIRGRTMMEFSEVETGIWEGERPDGVYFLQSVDSLGPPPRTAEEMTGEWRVVRGEKAICGLTLALDKFDQDSFILKSKPGCDAAVIRFGLSSWHMDRGELLLVSPRGVWRFEELEPSSWRRVPETADPILLVKQ